MRKSCCCLAGILAVGLLFPAQAFPQNYEELGPPSNVSDSTLETIESNSPCITQLNKVPQEGTGNPVIDDGSPRGPGADDCANASVAVDGANPFDTTAATPDGPNHTAAQCQGAGTLNNNVWFSYTATCTGELLVTTCSLLGGSANYDTRIAAYSGDCNNLVLLGCNDDDPYNSCGAAAGGFTSTLRFDVDAGQTILISVGGFDGASVGTGSLFIACNANACGKTAYKNDFRGVAVAGNVTVAVNNHAGNAVTLIAPNLRVCQVFQWNRCTTLAAGTPYDVQLNIWDACPGPQSGAPAPPCNTANLLYSSLMDAPLQAVAAGGAFSRGVWTIPNLDVCSRTLWITFQPVTANTAFLIDDTGPEFGTQNGGAILCYAGTNSGCGWGFGAGAVASSFMFSVRSQPVPGPGACCDFSNGNCTEVVGQTNCTGGTLTFTPASCGGDCDTPGPNFTCVALVGACCNLTTDVCTDGALPTECNAADQRFSLGQTCAQVICPLTCEPGGDGQVADYQGHGGSLARTADLSPEFAGFRVADNFSPDSNTPLTSVRWWGIYRNFLAGNINCTPQSGDVPDNFTITIWSDALGLPFQIAPGGGPHNVTPTKLDTGFNVLTNPQRRVFQYTVSGLNIPMEQDLCYWIEITNDTTGGDCQWQWLAGPEGDLKAVQHDVLGGEVPPWLAEDVVPHDMAFCVSFPIADDTCDTAIELPGACCIVDPPFCTSVGPSECANLGGTFTATGEPCPNPVNSTPLCKGACCVEAGCIIVIQSECNAQSGTWFGVGSDCDPDPCNGACCLSDGSCIDSSINQLTCETPLPSGFSGSWTGGGTCATVVCATFDQCDIDGVGTPNGVPVLACDSSTNFNNRAQATDETDGIGDPFPDNPNPSCFGGNGQDDGVGNFWVAFTGTGSSVEISTCGSEAADTVIAVYKYAEGQGCPTLLVLADELACSEDDDACGEGSLQSRLCLDSTVNGDTYYVQVMSFAAADVGNILVNVNCPCPVACACPGDTSGDGELDAEDVQSFADCLITPGPACACADSDGDAAADDEFGATGDIADFVTKLLNGATCPP